MVKLTLVKTPNPALLSSTKPVKQIDQKTKQIVREMMRILNACQNPIGVGLAAPQVGLNLQIFLIKPTAQAKIRCFINPKIINSSAKQNQNKKTLEGCLSVHNVWANIQRAKWVELEYLSLQNKQKREKFTGWEAQIVLHEMDHLNGVLFTHRALEQNKQLYRIIRKKGKERLEPLEL